MLANGIQPGNRTSFVKQIHNATDLSQASPTEVDPKTLVQLYHAAMQQLFFLFSPTSV